MRNTFKVYERLKREQHIETLFRCGKAFSVFPLRLVYVVVPRPAENASPVLAGFSVPKKKFSLSVDRHRVRRLLSENWRLKKNEFYTAVPAGLQLHLFIIYNDRSLPQFAVIDAALDKGLAMLKTKEGWPNMPEQTSDSLPEPLG